MKKPYPLLLLFLLLLSSIAFGQSNTQNYVKTVSYKVKTASTIAQPNAREASISITYLDGLARPIQQIAHQQSASGKDIVTPVAYDAQGRQLKEYLPYAAQDASMNFHDNALSEQQQYVAYAGQNAYSEKRFEQSPLNRVLQQAAPGTSWAMPQNGTTADHTIKMAYLSNTDADQVKQFVANSSWNAAKEIYESTLSGGGNFYAAGMLYKTVIKDENWKATDGSNHTQEEFKNMQGQVILKRAYNNGQRHDTYSVYDVYGNSSFVIPPLASSSSSINLDGLCYQYRYDAKNRLAEKKLPGKQWEYIVYDRLDRIVATGPALSPFSDSVGTNGWLIIKYDIFGRTVLTGWMQAVFTNSSRKDLQALRNAQTSNLAESRTASNSTVNNITFGYTNQAWPTGNSYHVLTVNYFDDYSFPDAPATIPSAVLADNSQAVYYNASQKPKGLSTGTWVRVLQASTASAAEKTYVLYDSLARPVRTYLKNYLGGYTQTDLKLYYSGSVKYTETRHKRVSGTELLVKEAYTYSDQGFMLTHTHQINGGAVELLSKNSYDEMGQLVSKATGRSESSPLQKTDYKYNIRGWLKEINDVENLSLAGDPKDLFGFKINYDAPESTLSYSPAGLFNGNVSETYWKTSSDNVQRKYSYEYDGLGRMRKAVYQKPKNASAVPNSYNEELDYDMNGNISWLNRNGNRDSDRANGGVEEIDHLSYAYDTNFPNRLLNVTDASLSPIGFRDSPTAPEDDYAYDANGNMIRDLNKGISKIEYNHLNLPVKIVFGTEVNKIEYLYTASGKKIQKTYPYPSELAQNGYATNLIEYLDGFQYQNGSLKTFPTAEGYVTKTVSIYSYVYNHTDHLGNVRLSYALDASTGSTKILEENHYYPFGMKHANYNSDQLVASESQGRVSFKAIAAPVSPAPPMLYNYKFNGMELQDEMGLNLYDMPFRDYDPAIGRWTGMDPVIDYSASPYNGYDNNPVFWADPSGADVVYNDNGVTATGADISSMMSAIGNVLDGNDPDFQLMGNMGYSTPNDITVDSNGVVISIIKNSSANRFFDEKGKQLFFNDPKNDFSLIGDWSVGDNLYYPISSNELAMAVYGAGLDPLLLRSQGKLGEAWLMAAIMSRGSADFTVSYLVKKYFSQGEKSSLETGTLRSSYNSYMHFFRFGSSNRIYNLYDAGNFMFGNWMKTNGFNYSSLLFGSQINEGFGDSVSDQRAIKNGYYFKS